MSDIQAGTYTGRAVKGSEQYGEKNGKPYMTVELTITELNRTLTTFLYFSEAAKPYAIDRLKALGCYGAANGNLDGIDANAVRVVVKYEKYQGEDQMKVDILTGGSVRVDNPMDEKRKRSFLAEIASALKAEGAKPPANGGAKPAPKPAPVEDDEAIPF